MKFSISHPRTGPCTVGGHLQFRALGFALLALALLVTVSPVGSPITLVRASHTGPETVYIDPPLSSGIPGSSVTITVSVTGFETTLFNGYDIMVVYDVDGDLTVLDATSIDKTGCIFESFQELELATLIDRSRVGGDVMNGVVRVASVIFSELASGPGCLFRINFDIVGTGTALIEVRESTLTNPLVPSARIPHDVVNGSFSNTIDVKPGSDPNSINVKSSGVVPVAIITSNQFDAATVDSSTVRFGRTGTEASPVHSALEDVDGDGDADMILQFETQDTGIRAGDTQAILTGATFSGLSFAGMDSVRAFLPGDADGDLDVDIFDAALLAYAFGSKPHSLSWNPGADFDENDRVDILDAAMLALYFGTTA